jgi:hypothetical protein
MKTTKPLIVYLPDTRGVEISRYGRGNLKLGASVYTYSRPAGDKWRGIIDSSAGRLKTKQDWGTCPGSTDECEKICYAKRIGGPVWDVYKRNAFDDVPPIPDDCTLLRLHVSGDFDTVAYIENWIARLLERTTMRFALEENFSLHNGPQGAAPVVRTLPPVMCWTYTRSWRVPELLPALERLRALPNVQLFASLDSTSELPPAGWRRAWIDGDLRLANFDGVQWTYGPHPASDNQLGPDGIMSYVCPEETGRKPDCESCRYCFEGQHNDVTFLKH